MEALDLARWQFAITTVYHFLFVPVTIGVSAVVASYEVAWLRTRNPAYLRLTKWFGKLFTINFALGLVTGIVQEFQFGMNWSDYSRFVGDIFGAPLAIEALLAFFLESTFLGLWIFGWDKLPPRLHAACIWLVHIGTVLSAYFILAANSFMQNPVGFTVNLDTGRAELTDFVAVLTNKVQLVTFPHTVTAAYMVGGAFVMTVGLWQLRRNKDNLYRTPVRWGAWLTLVAALGVSISGDLQGKVMTEVQPMKMASAEALYDTAERNAPFSIVTIGSLDGTQEKFAVTLPNLLSFLATGTWDGKVEGINDLQQEYRAKYGQDPTSLTFSESYSPTIPLTYWTFRLMIGVGMFCALVAVAVLWATRRGKHPDEGMPVPLRRFWPLFGVIALLSPILGNSFGWIFTETGRQPWLVFGLMSTATGVSPSVSTAEVLTSMVVFTLLYAALAAVEVGLMLRYVRQGAPDAEEPQSDLEDEDRPLAFAY